MANCTGDNLVQTIDRTECIGNSLVKINSNFAALDKATCELSNSVATVGNINAVGSPTINLSYDTSTKILSADISGKVPNVNGGAGTLTGLLKASGGVVSQAVAGVDYMAPGSGSSTNLTGDITSLGAATSYSNVVPSTKGGAGAVNGILKANGVGTVTQAVVDTDYASPMPAGAIMAFYRNAAPTGWLECNGQSAAAYPTLVALGITNVPDLRGEFIRGWDHGRGVDSGRGLGSNQLDSYKSHKHGVTLSHESGGSKDPYGWPGVDGSAPIVFHSENEIDNSSCINNGGGNFMASSGGSETRPRNVAFMYCIKY